MISENTNKLDAGHAWVKATWWMWVLGPFGVGMGAGVLAATGFFGMSIIAGAVVVNAILSLGLGLNYRRWVVAAVIAFPALLVPLVVGLFLCRALGTTNLGGTALLALLNGLIIGVVGLAIVAVRPFAHIVYNKITLHSRLKEDAANQGYLAFQNGKGLHENPFDPSTSGLQQQLFECWVRGYSDAAGRRTRAMTR